MNLSFLDEGRIISFTLDFDMMLDRFNPMIKRCDCGQHWTGPTCEEDVDECDMVEFSEKCLNHAVCVNTEVTYGCSCVTCLLI